MKLLNKKSDDSSEVKPKKRLDISARSVVDNIVFSKREVWAYYKVAPVMIDFISNSMIVDNASRVSTAFTSLVENSQEPLEVHLITTSTPIDVEMWKEQALSIVKQWEDDLPKYNEFILRKADLLDNAEYSKRISYIGIKLGNRGALDTDGLNPISSGWKSSWDTLLQWADNIGRSFDGDVSADEERSFRAKESKFQRLIANGALKGSPVTAEELLLLIKRSLYPAMTAPYLNVDYDHRWGAGDLDLETASVILPKYRSLEIGQYINGKEYVGHRAGLTFTKFPKNATYPNNAVPFLYYPSLVLGIPFTTYARVTLLPNKKMRKEINKKRKEQLDQLKSYSSGGIDAMNESVADTSEIQQSMEDLRYIDELTNQDKSPWVKGSYRVILEANKKSVLLNMVALIKQEFAEIGITTQLTSGDQMDILLEQMPGDHKRINAFNQITNINQLSTSGFNIASNVGDNVWTPSDYNEYIRSQG